MRERCGELGVVVDGADDGLSVLCVAALLGALLAVGAAASTEGTVVELNEMTFDAAIGTGNWFVKFYAPVRARERGELMKGQWCGHCRAMEAAYDELARKVGSRCNIAQVWA